MPSASDVYITPASQKIEFYDSSSVVGKLYYSSPYMRIKGDASSGLAFEGNNGLHYFIGAGSSPNNRLFVYNYADGSGYGTYAANYLQLRDGSSNIEASLVAGNGSFVSGNLGIGTNTPAQKLYVSGGAATFDNGGSHSVYFKNAGSQYGAIDTYGSSLSIEATNEAILSGASGVVLKGGNYGVLLSPIGTSAGDTSRLRFRELAANGTADVSIKAPDSISSGIQMILPAAAGTANQVLAIDSVSSGIMTLGFQNAGGSPGGSNTQLQYNNGGSFGGIDDLVWDGDKLLLGDSSDTGNYLLVEGSDSDNTYTVFEGKRKYPRIRLTDTQPASDKTFDIWNLGSQLRFGSNAGSSTVAAMYIQHGQPSDGLNYGTVTMNSGVMMGTTSPINSARLSIVDTTRPLLLGYDGSNYVNFDVGSSGQLTIDAGNDINLDAHSGLFNFKDGGTEFFRIGEDGSSNTFLQTKVDAKDILFKQYDGTEVMRITDNQRVGIGLDTPTSKLHVKGELDIQGGNQTILMGAGNSSTARNDNALKLARVGLAHYHNNEEPVGMLYAYSNGTDNGLVIGAGTSAMNSPTKIQFTTAANDATIEGSTRLQINSDGNAYFTENLGIGTTSPSTKLHVIGNALIDGYLHADKDGSPGLLVGEGGDADIYYDGTDMKINSQRVGSGDLHINATGGNVGIGTTSPSYPLQVMGAIALGVAGNSYTGDRIQGDTGKIKFIANGGVRATLDGTGLGIGTTAPAAGLHISSTETTQLRITSGSNTQCDFKVSQYGGLTLDVNHTLDLDVTRHIDYNVGSSRLHRFYVGGTQTLQHQLESGGGLLDFKGTQGKIWHAATPVAQIKDDVGIIMEDNQGIRNHVQTLANWALDAATGNGQTSIQGFSKIQNINTAGIAAPELGAFSALQVVLPSATAGDEYIVVFGSSQSNLTGKNMILKANGSETINSGSSTGSVTYTKNTGESIHVVCYETGKWTVVSHV